MSYVILGGIAVILALCAALAIAVKTAAARGRKNAELEDRLLMLEETLKKQREYYLKKEEAQKNADKKKALLHTGDNAVDFNNSLKLLHGAGKDRKC